MDERLQCAIEGAALLTAGTAGAYALLALMWALLWLCCQFGVAFLGW